MLLLSIKKERFFYETKRNDSDGKEPSNDTEPTSSERNLIMNRRDFLKSALTIAALAPITRLAAKAGDRKSVV